MNFADLLLGKIEEKQNPSCVGLDPVFEKIPQQIKEEARNKFGANFEGIAQSFLEFNRRIIDSVAEIAPAVKPQMAFYEKYGNFGVRTFEETVKYAHKKKLVVIEDAKRGDIGSTAEAYSSGHLGRVASWNGNEPGYDVDCITVNPYLGIDGIKPFIEDAKKYGKGIFVLVKTSNPSSGELQDLDYGNKKIYDVVAGLVNKWGEGTEGARNYRPVGAVVGATYPQEAAKLRKTMEKSIFLVPGYGAQGGTADDTVPCFNKDGCGAIVNSSRGIIFAYQDEKWKNRFTNEKFDDAAKAAALEMKEAMAKSLKKADIFPW